MNNQTVDSESNNEFDALFAKTMAKMNAELLEDEKNADLEEIGINTYVSSLFNQGFSVVQIVDNLVERGLPKDRAMSRVLAIANPIILQMNAQRRNNDKKFISGGFLLFVSLIIYLVSNDGGEANKLQIFTYFMAALGGLYIVGGLIGSTQLKSSYEKFMVYGNSSEDS